MRSIVDSAARARHAAPWWARLRGPVPAEVLAFIVAVLARGVGNAGHYDIFIDEVTYLRLAQGAAQDLGVHLYGEPFHLHPPGFTYLEAAWLWLTGGVGGPVVDQVLAVRWLNVLLAAATVVAGMRLARIAAGPWAALAAGVLLALDPFLVRISSRNLVEPAAVLAIVLGWLVLAGPLARGRPVGTRRAVAAGALFGVALLVKEVSLLSTVVPVLVAALLVRLVARRTAAIVAGTALGVYAVYPVGTALAGQFGDLVDQKASGTLRFLGVLQTTGFNAPGSVGFGQRVVERLELFGATYALLGAAVPVAVLLLLRGRPVERLLALWTAGAFAYGAWSVVGGTLEEQLFYFLAVPAALTCVVAGARLVRDRAQRRWPVVALLAAWCAAALMSWAVVHAQPDDTYRRMTQWVATELRETPTARVGVTSDPGDVLLRGVEIMRISSLAEAHRADADYVLVGTRAVENGTARVEPDLLALLEQPAAVVHVESGRSAGDLVLLRVPR